jgi:uridine kinase
MIIGISGGTGSGKTTVANRILEAVSASEVVFIHKVFVDTPDDIRFIRRLRRDIAERGRTVESVIEQYLVTVRPMHMQFVEPSKRYADVIIPEGGHNLVSIGLLSGKIGEKLASTLTSAGGQR